MDRANANAEGKFIVDTSLHEETRNNLKQPNLIPKGNRERTSKLEGKK